MPYYPICLDISGRPCLVVGGGRVAERKVAGLLEAGAKVTVVSPETTAAIEELARTGRVALIRRAVRPEDIRDVALVIAATDDRQVQAMVHREAEARGILVNVADVPEFCSFILPARVQRGDLSIAVSTSGASPALAKRIRERLEGEFGPEYGPLLAIMAALRCRVLARNQPSEDNERFFGAMLEQDLAERVRRGEVREILDLVDRLWPGLLDDPTRASILNLCAGT